VNLVRDIGQAFLRERDRWLLWAPLGIGAGIIIYFQWPREPPLWTLGITALLAVAMIGACRSLPLMIALLVPLLILVGFNAGQIETRLVAAPMLNRSIGPTSVTGRLVFTEVMPEGVRLTLKNPDIDRLRPEQTPLKVRIRLNRKTLADVPPAGSLINLWAEVGPFSEPVMPHAANFRWQAFFRQLGGLGWSTSTIRLIDPNPPVTSWRDEFWLAFERARLALSQHVYAHLSGDVAAMTATRLNGQQTTISAPVIQAMRVAGLAHLLSTSGFHVTIMGLLVYFPLRAILALIPWIALRFPIKKWAACSAILSTVGYTLLVGSAAATLRSMIMTGIAMVGVIADRPAAVMRLVMLSAGIVMLMVPDAMLGPSFQMSFAAVLCLIAAYERVPGKIKSKLRFGLPAWLEPAAHYLFVIMRTSLIATAATTPFSIYHFGTFSFYGFAANALAIPLTSFWVMPCILMAYLTVPLGWDGPFITGAGWGVAVTIKIAETVASWPYALLHAPAMPAPALAAVVLGGLWLCLWRRRWRFWGLLPVMIGMLYPLYTMQPDFMIADDGKEWAARLDDGRLAASTLRHDKFTFEQWQERLGNPDLVDIKDLPPEENQLRCDEAGCVYCKYGHILALPRIEAAALEDCERADILVAPFLIRDCAAKTVIDDPALWTHGAHAIYFRHDGSVRTEYTRERRGKRPWSEGWKGDLKDAD